MPARELAEETKELLDKIFPDPNISFFVSSSSDKGGINVGDRFRRILDEQLEKERKYYIVIQKNFFAYNKERLRTIDNSSDFNKAFASWNKSKNNATPAWKIFNSFEKYEYFVKVGQVEYKNLAGKILFWSDVKESDKNNFLDYTKELNGKCYSDVIGLTQMINDLNNTKDSDYVELIKKYISWNNDLFSNILT